MRCPVVIGRDEELAALADLVAGGGGASAAAGLEAKPLVYPLVGTISRDGVRGR